MRSSSSQRLAMTIAQLSRNLRRPFALLATVVAFLCAPTVLAVDWQGLTPLEITLFYPGQHSWEWVLTPTDHGGAGGIRKGSNCRACHAGQQADMGKAIAARTGLPAVTDAGGTAGSMAMDVQTAWDNNNFYLRVSWPVRGDGKPGQLTVMLDDGQVTEATRAGCWGACHDDLKGMASAAPDASRSKYLVASRNKVSRQGGGDNLKSSTELAALRTQGKFLEYWQVQVRPAALASAGDGHVIEGHVIEGYVLEQRHEHSRSLVNARVQQRDGRWIIELSRPRIIDAPGRKALTTANSYTLGFAVHESGSKGRFHYVSFGYSLKLAPGTADMISKRLD